MTRRQVWRYKCDFCKKSNCSGPSVKKHERGCTNNPARICGMHVHCKAQQPPLQGLAMNMFKDNVRIFFKDKDTSFDSVTEEGHP